MKYTNATRELFNRLNAGEVFVEILPHRLGGTFFWQVLSADSRFIYWRHYGSSANKNKLESLAWILENIFNMTAEEFLSKYTTRSAA